MTRNKHYISITSFDTSSGTRELYNSRLFLGYFALIGLAQSNYFSKNGGALCSMSDHFTLVVPFDDAEGNMELSKFDRWLKSCVRCGYDTGKASKNSSDRCCGVALD